MPPYYSKPYPLTAGLSHCFTPVTPKYHPLPLETTSLAHLQTEPVDSYLRKIVRLLKEPLQLFPKIIAHCKFSVRILSDLGIVEQFDWELTITEASTHLNCVLDALGIINQGLFQSKILLKHVEQYLDVDEDVSHEGRDPTGFSEEEVQKLTKLKVNLLKLSEFLDRVLMCYSNTSLSCDKPSKNEIKSATKKIYKVINSLNPDKLIKDLIPKSMITEEDVLCSVLGLQDEFAYRLSNLTESMRKHQTDMYYLLCYMEERYDSSVPEDLSDEEAVKRSLKELGFTEFRSQVIAKWITGLPFREHKSLLAWAQIYIENLFKYDIFLNDHVSKYPYEEKNVGKWFTVKVEREKDEDEDDCVIVYNVPGINTTDQDVKTVLGEKISEFEQNNPEGKLYFHGTDHEGARDILENGIRVDRGKGGCEFSDGTGFYVADSLEYALEWAKGKFTAAAAAVVIFDISDQRLSEFRGLDLRDHDRRNDLRTVREYYKSGRKQKIPKKKLNELNNCDFIMGPIGRDGTERKPTQDVQQICITKERMADKIGNPSLIVGVVFLSMKDNRLARRK